MNNNSIRVAVMTGCMAKFSENIHHPLFSICHSHNPSRPQFLLPWLIGFFIRVIWRMPLVEHVLLSSTVVEYVLFILIKYMCWRFIRSVLSCIQRISCKTIRHYPQWFCKSLFFIYVIFALCITYVGVQPDFHSRRYIFLYLVPFETCSRHHEYIWNIIELMLTNIQLIN